MPPTLALEEVKKKFKNWKSLSRKIRFPLYQKAYRDSHKEKRHQEYLRYYKTHKQFYITRARKQFEEVKIWFDRFKNKPCFDCQGWFEPCQMDFDHRNPQTKIADITWLKRGNKQRLLEEINKCDLVCANCHRLRTQKRFRATDKEV